MDKTVEIVEFLQNWQEISYEEVESASDIKVFNVIGTIVQLVKNGYMPIERINYFIIDVLELTDEEELRVSNIVTNAYESIKTIH